jgi:hypothetical protein
LELDFGSPSSEAWTGGKKHVDASNAAAAEERLNMVMPQKINRGLDSSRPLEDRERWI